MCDDSLLFSYHSTNEIANRYMGIERLNEKNNFHRFSIEYAFYIFKGSIPIQRLFDTVQFNSYFYFWLSQISDFTEQKFTQSIVNTLSHFFKKDSIIPLVSPQKATVFSEIGRPFYSFIKPSRLLIIYSNLLWTKNPKSPPNSFQFEDQCVSVDDFIKQFHKQKMCLIVDRNYSGAICEALKRKIKTESDNIDDLNVIGFFSCKSTQVMNHSQYLPYDTFTSCMFTPEKVAISWHLRNYHQQVVENHPNENVCNILDITEDQRERIIDIITSTVKSIAYKHLSRKQFNQIFNFDLVLSKLFVNFIFSTRVLGQINNHPLSIPALPDMAHDQLWRNYDYLIDNVLKIPQFEIIRLLTSSFEQKVNSGIYFDNFVFEISCFRHFLKYKELCGSACKHLAMFFDQSPNNIELAINFNIQHSLLDFLLLILEENKQRDINKKQEEINFEDNNHEKVITDILFCLIKLCAYVEDDRFSNTFSKFDKLKHKIDLLNQENFHLTVILLCLVERWYELKVQFNNDRFVNETTKIWALHYFAIASTHTYNKNQFFWQIKNLIMNNHADISIINESSKSEQNHSDGENLGFQSKISDHQSCNHMSKNMKKAATHSIMQILLSNNDISEILNDIIKFVKQIMNFEETSIEPDLVFEVICLATKLENKEATDEILELCKKCDNDQISNILNNLEFDDIDSKLIENDIASLLLPCYK
ncbi:hypothetical protein TRFO_01927 [Tritrichomonas foetus]|uniref:Uncharacterized protein n=1 Tax=Tritrichomonas foetus TaxID=1144522 RepID=A0A1J4JNK5_9EUKA|nr:hypothetical protein TRFO_01927 [Tritrichomonas foetus]|eukprot:OHS98844.1 hypothetical protein TRFO_01927 [Tritrichomonas foetus]